MQVKNGHSNFNFNFPAKVITFKFRYTPSQDLDRLICQTVCQSVCQTTKWANIARHFQTLPDIASTTLWLRRQPWSGLRRFKWPTICGSLFAHISLWHSTVWLNCWCTVCTRQLEMFLLLVATIFCCCWPLWPPSPSRLPLPLNLIWAAHWIEKSPTFQTDCRKMLFCRRVTLLLLLLEQRRLTGLTELSVRLQADRQAFSRALYKKVEGANFRVSLWKTVLPRTSVWSS